MSSSHTTGARGRSAQIGALISVDGYSSSRALSSTATLDLTKAGTPIPSYKPVTAKFEPEGYLEGDSYSGPPYVPDDQVSHCRGALREILRHAESGLTPSIAHDGWRERVTMLLGQLRASKKSEKMGKEEAEARMNAMLEELADIPIDVLADAIKQARLSPDEWFPTGGKIRAYAMPELNRRKLRAMRLREWGMELKRREESNAKGGGSISDEDRAWLDEYMTKLKAGGKPSPTRRSGPPDPNDPPEGISKEVWAEMIAAGKQTGVLK